MTRRIVDDNNALLLSDILVHSSDSQLSSAQAEGQLWRTSFQISGDCLMKVFIKSLHESRSVIQGATESGEVHFRPRTGSPRFTTSTPWSWRMDSPVGVNEHGSA